MKRLIQEAQMSIEIERRFLLASAPPLSTPALAYAKPLKITQTALKNVPGHKGYSRVRKTRSSSGKVSYHWAAKKRISSVSKEETETQINESMYTKLLRYSTGQKPLEKTRWVFKIDDIIYEIDHVKGETEQWILEVELTTENQNFTIPSFLNIQEELTK